MYLRIRAKLILRLNHRLWFSVFLFFSATYLYKNLYFFSHNKIEKFIEIYKIMKHILAVFTFLFLNNILFAQNLSLAQLLEVKKKELGNAEEYLTAKNWEFIKANEPEENKLGSATFTYNKDDMSNRAESFLTYLYSDNSTFTRISIQINQKSKYNEYINSIKAYGCKLILSKVEDGNIIKIYRGNTTTFRVTSSTSTNFFNESTAAWNLFIISNDDYEINLAEE